MSNQQMPRVVHLSRPWWGLVLELLLMSIPPKTFFLKIPATTDGGNHVFAGLKHCTAGGGRTFRTSANLEVWSLANILAFFIIFGFLNGVPSLNLCAFLKLAPKVLTILEDFNFRSHL